VHVDASLDQIRSFNAAATAAASGEGAASSSGGGYDAGILEELPSRFERPNDRNRWERPLFVLRPDDEAESVAAALADLLAAVDGRELKPNLATVQVPHRHLLCCRFARVGRGLRRARRASLKPTTHAQGSRPWLAPRPRGRRPRPAPLDPGQLPQSGNEALLRNTFSFSAKAAPP
jgi:hypothetical protein